MEKIFLNSSKSKETTERKNSLNVKLEGVKRILPSDYLLGSVNGGVLYSEERFSTNKIRLNCVIHPYCSNVLFNPFTEITYKEGSEYTRCFDTDSLKYIDDIKTIYKDKDESFETTGNSRVTEAFRNYNLIDDTQLSSVKRGNLSYHCGLDFFNNHVLRGNTFKIVNPLRLNSDKESTFNTLVDYHRDYDGNVVSGDTSVVGDRDFKSTAYKQHLYQREDILSFTDAVKSKLREQNGWFGFYNTSKVKINYNTSNGTYDKRKKEYEEYLDIHKPINNKEACEFVDMYPTRDLFYFTPKYNKYRHRIEKNWNYCLTYPSSSTTEVPFIDNTCNGLRIILIDENYPNEFKISSMTKHGLKEEDFINLYRDGELEIVGLKVTTVEDDYTFFVDANNKSINAQYKESTTLSIYQNMDNTSYMFSRNGLYYYDTNSDFMTFSFKKIEGSEEVDYYVRIFSKLPNWKFADEELTECAVYEDQNQEFLKKYQEKDFENHIGKVAFSKTIYNDDVSEIIFKDDIDLSYLKDNLGRPLHNIYLTIVKNNKGNIEWYQDNNYSADTVEYSHCFSEVTCGFLLNPMMLTENHISGVTVPLSDINTLHYTPFIDVESEEELERPFSGLSMSHIGGEETDEISIDSLNFYGDLCSYSHTTCQEQTIQNCGYRFNTYQREHNGEKKRKLNFCNVLKDDYDVNRHADTEDFLTCTSLNIGQLPEGYYYQPHYVIPIHEVSNELKTEAPKVFSLRFFKKEENKIFTNENNYFNEGDKFMIWKRAERNSVISQDTVVSGTIKSVISLREFTFEIAEDSVDTYNEIVDDILQHKSSYKILRKNDELIPAFAEFLRDGTCKYVWRNIIKNGFNKLDSSVETYPFTNGRLYVMKDINFFLKRQNASNERNGMTNLQYDDYNIDGHFIKKDKLDNYENVEDIIC